MTLRAETLVETPAESASLAALRHAAGESDGVMEGHCLRCFRLCELLALKHGKTLDREVMLCAAFLHDIGLYPAVSEGGVYTEEGGEEARRIATEHGWDSQRADLCAEACAKHHSVKRQWELGAEVEVLRLADRIEVTAGISTGGLDRAQIKDVFVESPRDGFYHGLYEVVWPNLRSRPMTIPKIFKP